MQPLKSVNIYYSYTHEDQQYLAELEKHLAPLKRTSAIKTWSSQDILAGSEWKSEIAHHLNEADIILLLVSPDFLASDYCYYEAQRALEQSMRRQVRVIPILLRSVDWQATPFGGFQSLPRDGKPITSHASRDKALFDIVREIRDVVESIRSSSFIETNWIDEAQRHYQAHQYVDALAAYEQAIKLEPANSEAWLGKGECLRELQRYEEALIAYEQAIRINPNTLQAYVGRGVASYNLNRFHEALSSYEQAIALDPAIVNAHLRKSDVLYYLKRYEEALVGYQRAIQLDSKNVDAYVGMGNTFAQLQQYEQALRSYQNALPLVSAPEEALLCFRIGNMQVCLKHYEDAITFYSRAIAVDPRNIEAYLGQGKVLTELGRIEEALLDYERVLMLEPANAEAHRAKVTLLSLRGFPDAAEVALEDALRLGIVIETSSESASPQFLRARIDQIQHFLTNAGFSLAQLPNQGGFLATATLTMWKKRFPRGLYIRALFESPLDQRTVQTVYHEAKRYTDHALVVINTQPKISGWGEINVLRGEQGKHRFVCLPIDESLVQEAIATHQELQTIQYYINERLGKGFDPYDVRDPVSGAVSFFGRQRLTEELLDALRRGQRLGLFGIHKMGKSSVLQELQKKAEFPVAYVYLREGDDLASIYTRIVEEWVCNARVKYPDFQWNPPLPCETPAQFTTLAKELLGAASTVAETPPLLGVFLDEIERLVPYEGDYQTLRCYLTLMDSLRGLQQETRSLPLLVAGIHPGIARRNFFWNDAKNPMHQVIIEKFLPPLDEEDCAYMIQSLGQQVNLTFDSKALGNIVQASGAHPYLARQICSMAYKRRRDMQPITAELVEEVVQEFIRNPATYSYFDDYGLWGELSKSHLWSEAVGKANHALLLLLAERTHDLSEDELLSCGIEKNVARQAFNALKERGIISSPDHTGYYRIRFGLLQDWIRLHVLEREEEV